jgi:ribonuclease HII
MIYASLDLEQDLWSKGHTAICGVDEVGRGCLAGPVYAAAVVFPKDHTPIKGIADSKLLTPEKRQVLAEQIATSASAFAIGIASVDTINAFNILKATFMAMNQSINKINFMDYLLIDGNQVPGPHKYSDIPTKALVSGDRLCYSIAAASIIAKVARDAYMDKLHLQFPYYKWKHNKGYATPDHRDAIQLYGQCQHHRTKFLRRLIPQ